MSDEEPREEGYVDEGGDDAGDDAGDDDQGEVQQTTEDEAGTAGEEDGTAGEEEDEEEGEDGEDEDAEGISQALRWSHHLQMRKRRSKRKRFPKISPSQRLILQKGYLYLLKQGMALDTRMSLLLFCSLLV